MEVLKERTFMKEHLQPYFANVEDPRSVRNQKHPFLTLIGTTLLACLGGQDSFTGIADFVEAHLEALRVYFDFPEGVPSHDTYQRLWDGIDPVQFSAAFHLFTKTLVSLSEGVVSIDGKTIRQSGKEQPFVMVSAWCEANQLVLGHQKVVPTSNEITTIPKLLRLLDVKNRIVTIDAIGAQREICQQILDQEGDYLIALKKNQRTLQDDVQTYFQDPALQKDCLRFEQSDKGHGRLETRTAFATGDVAYLKDHAWPGLRSIAMVVSSVTRGEKRTQETRYYLSSLPADAQRSNTAARAHWGIENKLHWRLDVVFNEDKGCIRNENASENMDIARKWALNVLHKAKTKPDQSLKSLMRKNAMSFSHLLATVKKVFHA